MLSIPNRRPEKGEKKEDLKGMTKDQAPTNPTSAIQPGK
jgi:hypothetical protein